MRDTPQKENKAEQGRERESERAREGEREGATGTYTTHKRNSRSQVLLYLVFLVGGSDLAHACWSGFVNPPAPGAMPGSGLASESRSKACL